MTLIPAIASMRQLVILTLSWLVCLGRVAAQVTDSTVTSAAAVADISNTSMITTPVPDFGVVLTHLGSSTSSITVEWTIPSAYDAHIMEYMVQARKKDSDSVLRSPSITPTERLYEVADLMTNSHYEICIYAKFKEGHEVNGSIPEACDELYTLALIRNDSLIALFAALGYIVLMILIGYLCWYCAQKRSKGAASEDGSGDEQEELLEKKDDSGQHLLAPPAQGRPRSSIEEELPYIPYITPPIEEMDNDREGKPVVRRGYSGASNNL